VGFEDVAVVGGTDIVEMEAKLSGTRGSDRNREKVGDESRDRLSRRGDWCRRFCGLEVG
jgi:hypothetical protein